jgi:hypothetical protein
MRQLDNRNPAVGGNIKNFVLGSGLIGCLAKHIFPDWLMIPMKKSRYYYFEEPYADNFIIYDKAIDDFMIELSPNNNTTIIMKRPFSLQGQLMSQETELTTLPYLQKVYGDKMPNAAHLLLKTVLSCYPMTAKMLYDKLQNRYLDSINADIKRYGELLRIDLINHKLITTRGEFEYEHLISTIPLDILCKFCNVEMQLEAISVCYYSLRSKKIDLEKADQVLVCDSNIDFFKVQVIDEDVYQFWTSQVIDMPYQYFGLMIGYDFEILGAKRIDKVIPLGEPPSLDHFKRQQIYCVGSNAQWNDFVDVTATIKKLRSMSF